MDVSDVAVRTSNKGASAVDQQFIVNLTEYADAVG